MSRNMHKYEELTPYEFDREKEKASIIYIAASPVEYHEEGAVLGFDTIKGYEWCLEAAEKTGGIVFPVLPVAPEKWTYMTKEELLQSYKDLKFSDTLTERVGIYPSIFFSGETCRRVYTELLEALSLEMKFKLCVFVGSHGPAGALVSDIVKEFNEKNPVNETFDDVKNKNIGIFNGMYVMSVRSITYCNETKRKLYRENGIRENSSVHGGLWEAALNYAINPEYFQPQYLDETKYPQHYGSLPETEETEMLRPSKSELRKLTPEFAKEIHEATVNGLVQDVTALYKHIK